MILDQPFLEAIANNPLDDAPKLIYADWLDENGEEKLAEYVRLHTLLLRNSKTTEYNPDQFKLLYELRLLEERHKIYERINLKLFPHMVVLGRH